MLPNFSIFGGDHNTKILGRFMYDIHEKDIDTDKDIIIKSDVCSVASVIIFKCIIIQQGLIIAARCVVTKDIEEYAIYAGNPAKFIKHRFSEKDLILHKTLLSKNII